MIGIALLVFFFALIIFRVPIGWALAGASMAVLVLFTDSPLSVGAQRISAGVTSFPLLAIPLFILAGSLMNAGGMTSRLIDLAESIVGRVRGGLAQTNALSSMLFGGLSGSAVADVASLGKILIPAMKERNYKAAYAAVVTASTSVIAPVMPPSITLIVYGVVSGTSISDLFIAGLVPAVIYILVMMVTIHFTVNKFGLETAQQVLRTQGEKVRSGAGHTGPSNESGGTSHPRPKPFLTALLRALPALGMPVLILVGIRGGFFTPTEAAGVAVVYALVVGLFIYREFTVERLKEALNGSSRTVGLIMLVMASAQLYSWALSIGNVPATVASALSGLTDNPILMLLFINVILLIVGMFIEANAAIIIMTPLLLPLAMDAGVDPVHFGIILVINMGIGLITPPVGVCLMLAAEIAKTTYKEAIRAVLPFLGAGAALLLLVTYVPAISLWLPAILGG